MKTSIRIALILASALGLAASVQAQPRSITNQLVLHLNFDSTLRHIHHAGVQARLEDQHCVLG